LQSATLIILKYMLFLLYVAFLAIEAVNSSGMRAYVRTKPCLLNMQDQIWLTNSNNASFRLKHPGVPDGSDGSDGTSYPLTEKYTLPVAQATGRVA
jgi:hypothetical protein